MRTIWQGTDSFVLVRFHETMTLSQKYYAIKLRLFAKLADKFVNTHYACGELVEKNLKEFGMKKPIKRFHDPVKYGKMGKKPHSGFNILYYAQPTCKFYKWIYGYDIYINLTKSIKGVNWIMVDGNQDLSEIYPITDLLIRPNRHDGEPRMVMECELNNIPVIATKENPDKYDFFSKIMDVLGNENI